MNRRNDIPINVFVTALFPSAAIERMRQADPRANIVYDPSLMPEPRYVADRVGRPQEWTDELEEKWTSYAKEAEVILGFDRRHLSRLADLAPKLQWIQGSSTGIGPVVHQQGWADRGIVVTSARGIHAVPLAEFHLLSMLAFTKDIFHMSDLKTEKRFERYNTRQLRGKTVGIVGMGTTGREIARLSRAHGMRVLGIKRVFEGASAASLGVDRLYPKEQLADMVPECDFLSLCMPATPETLHLVDYDLIKQFKPGCVLINTSRGSAVVEADMVRALQDGTLRGAALDVFDTEPLPGESPLWDLDNVLISPHSASCAEFEDQLMTDLFIDNLHRYLDGLPLRNVIDPELRY